MSKQKQPCGFIEFYSYENIMSMPGAHNCYCTPRILPINDLDDSLELTKGYGMTTIAVLKIYLKENP